MKRLIIALAGAGLALSACATATPYQAIGETSVRGGYADERISENRFRVTFAGNTMTSRDTVEMYLLYRSAEITVQAGYDCFEAVSRGTDRDTRYVGSPDPWWGGSRWGPYWHPSWRWYGRGGWSRWDPFWGDDWDVREVTRYEAHAEIILRRGPCPRDERYIFDARDVLQNLGPRVARPVPR